MALSQRKCAEWTNRLSEVFGDEGITTVVDLACRDVRETLSLMYEATVLIGSGGSFSFVCGVSKGERFITPSLLGDTTAELCGKFQDLHLHVPWSMWPSLAAVAHPPATYADFDYSDDAPVLDCAEF